MATRSADATVAAEVVRLLEVAEALARASNDECFDPHRQSPGDEEDRAYWKRLAAAALSVADKTRAPVPGTVMSEGRMRARSMLVMVDVLESWGVRSRHGEWADDETRRHCARDILVALANVRPTCDGDRCVLDAGHEGPCS